MLSTITLLFLSLLSHSVVGRVCESFGVDFHNGGSYFQNISSTDPFTFVSIYENCEKDVATNILVDPNGDEYQCSDTPLQPDNTEELSTCPLDKNQMFSGPWAVLVLSNNGGGDPIGYERDFNLVVGIPATTTFTPTISVTVTSTPLSTTTSFTTTTTTETTTSTTVLPAKTRVRTRTIKPKPVTTTKTFGPTLKLTAYEFLPIVTTKTTTKTCRTSTQPRHDPTLTWLPTSLPSKLSNIVAELDLTGTFDASSRRRRDTPAARRVPLDRAQRISERKARIAAASPVLDKRAPDSSTTTITVTNTADFITSTATDLAPTSTIIIVNVISQTAITTVVSTVYSGTTTLPVQTVTFPTPTVTKLKPTIFTTTVRTITKMPVVTVTVGKVDPKATRACKVKGGVMILLRNERVV